MPDTASPCPTCGALLPADDSACPKCLLATGFGGDGQPEAERIFQVALSYPEDERGTFITDAAAGDPELLADVQMLLAGYAEEGGDDAALTIGGDKARTRWAAAREEEPGAAIDHFTLVRKIGEGGMGTVWEAEQTDPVKRTVALKVIKLGMDTHEVVARFERERQTLALMKHPGIAQVFEAGATELGRPYFAMELVEGEPINDFCANAYLSPREKAQLLIDTCAAIEHAHQRGVIHRDLKPSNILVDKDRRPRVIDFGVAKATREEGDPQFTRQSQVLGTPAYMSPEQADSDGADVDTRSDVYSLGIVLYELLAGAPPFSPERLASTSIAEIQKILREEKPVKPSTMLANAKPENGLAFTLEGIDRDLDRIVMKTIEKERDQRYRSASALADDLRRYLAGEAVSAVPPTAGYRLAKFVRRNKLATAAALALLCAFAVSIVQTFRAGAALEKQRAAQRETVLSIADLYANNGKRAAEDDEPAVAALWFAKAATTAVSDPERRAANMSRAAAWRSGLRAPLRAFDTGIEHIDDLVWNPAGLPAVAVGDSLQRWTIWRFEDEPEQWMTAGTATAMDWSPDGKRVAIGDGTTTRVLTYPGGTELAALAKIGGGNCAWSPDGEWLAVGSAFQLTLWNPKSGETHPAGGAYPIALAFEAASDRLLVQHAQSTEVRSASAPFDLVSGATPSVAGYPSRWLGTGDAFIARDPSGDDVVRNAATGEEIHRHSGEERQKGDSVASSDGRFFGRINGEILDRQSDDFLPFPTHLNQISALTISNIDRFIISAGYDQKLKFWSLPDGRQVGEFQTHHSATALALSPDDQLLATAESGLIRVWRAQPADILRVVKADSTSDAAISADGRWIAPTGLLRDGYNLRKTRVHELATTEPGGAEITTAGTIMAGTFATDGSWLALSISTTEDRSGAAFWTSGPGGRGTPGSNGGGSGSVQFWSSPAGEPMGEPVPVPSEPRGIDTHPDGTHVAVVCANGECVEIDVATRTARTLFQLPQPLHSPQGIKCSGRCSYSPDGKLVSVWGDIPRTAVWDRASENFVVRYAPSDESNKSSFDLAFHDGVIARTSLSTKPLIRFHHPAGGEPPAPDLPYTNWPMICRFDSRGQNLLTGGGDNIAQIWDWRAGSPAGPALEHEQAVLAGCFLPGDRRVATGGYAPKIRFWDAVDGMPARPPIEYNTTTELRMAPDGKTLVATGYYDGAIALIDLGSAFPELPLSAGAALKLAELEADARVNDGGGLLRFTPADWLAAWRDFRKTHPGFPGHKL